MEAISWMGCCLLHGRKPTASYIGVNFEAAFFSLIQLVFSDTFIVECLFHFKQANHRKMLKLGMHVVVVDTILLALDYAPCLPMDDIIRKGISYLKLLVKKWLKNKRSFDKVNKRTWALYWIYFEK